MNKSDLRDLIVKQLTQDVAIQFNAAISAHEASTHTENIPDNKYETLALEASYLAQGQANRAQEINRAIESYKQLEFNIFDADSTIGLTSLVTLESNKSEIRIVFIGPREGGMKLINPTTGSEIVVITPASPLGRNLIGRRVGDIVKGGSSNECKEFEIVALC